MDPPLHQSIHICKSIKLLDFTYSCYSSSFTFFLAYIHCFSEPSSYKEIIFYPLWQQAMDEKLGIWFLYLLVRVLLCIRSILILIGLLSDTKLSWLRKDTLNSMVWIMRRHLPLLIGNIVK
jgi:hypothetical protein